MLSALAIALLFGLNFGTLLVSGTTNCPDPVAVQRQLVHLLPPSEPSRDVVERASLESDGKTVRVRLLDASGVSLGERALPAQSDCEGLAVAAAVALAALADELPAEPPTPPARLALLSRLPPDVEPVSHPRWSTDVGLSALASEAGGWAGSGALLATFGRGNSPWRVGALFLAETERTIDLSPGGIVWQRLALGAGGAYRWNFAPSRLSLELEDSLLVALLLAHTSGFGQNPSLGTADLGFSFGARLLVSLGPWLPWVGLWSVSWPLPHPIELSGTTTSHNIPAFEFLGGVGLSLRSAALP